MILFFLEEDANEKRRSRRSILKKQKSPSKNGNTSLQILLLAEAPLAIRDCLRSNVGGLDRKSLKPYFSWKSHIINNYLFLETPDKPGSASKPDSQGVDGKRNKFGETTLFAAAKKGDLEKVKQLLEQGANPNVPDAAGKFVGHLT